MSWQLNMKVCGVNMDNSQEIDDIIITPDLTKFARTIEQAEVFESLENVITAVDGFILTNKKKDYEYAVNQIKYAVSRIETASNKGDVCEQSLVDVIHDSLLLPMSIIEYTAKKNNLETLI